MTINIDQNKFDINTHQEDIKQAVASLPSISFKRLMPPSLELKGLELLNEAESLSSQVTKLSPEAIEEKINLLKESFVYYKKFINCNKSQLNKKKMRDVAEDAMFVGVNMRDLLKDEAKKEAIQHAIKKIQIIAGYSDAAESRSINQTVDALNIPQNHFAVTSQPLGTTHVKDCIFLVLRNRETKSTYAAHIDFHSDSDSIIESIKQYLPLGIPLDGYIIGGTPPKKSNISIRDDPSLFRNISKVSQVLLELSTAGYKCEKHWSIFHEDTPHNIVYDPVTDEFTEAVPGKELPSYPSRELLVYLEENKNLLPFITQSFEKETEHSLCLSPKVQKKLNMMLDEDGGWSKSKVVKVVWDDGMFDILFYERNKAIIDAYSKAISEISASVKEFSPDSSDVLIKKTVMEVLKKNEEHSLYIFPFSNENAGLINKVVQKLQINL